jgi:hypothetical protein
MHWRQTVFGYALIAIGNGDLPSSQRCFWWLQN